MKNLITIISFAVVLLSSTAFSQLLLTAVYDGPIPDPLHDNAPTPLVDFREVLNSTLRATLPI